MKQAQGPSLPALIALIEDRFGLNFDGARSEILESRLQRRLRALELGSVTEYYQYLRCSPDREIELTRLSSIITNNETYFFREAYQFDILVEHVVPSLAEALKFRPLKILCAGCSSGEEAYSAVIALQNAGLELNRVRWEIDAHDINPERIARAEEAVYEESSVRNCSEEVRRRYFRPVNGHYQLRDRHRKGVRFFVTNLLAQGTWFAAEIYDVVLCRNMLIYLGEPAIYQLIGRFERLLRPGGYLLLGHAESLMDRDTSFQPVSVSGGIIYRKPSEG